MAASEDEREGESTGVPLEGDSDDYESDSDDYRFEADPLAGAPARRDRMPEIEWLPDEALASSVTGIDGFPREPRSMQVNVRLDGKRYRTLQSAAKVYGTTPTALARMLINRGATAILAAYRAELGAVEWPDPKG